jgi:hypothetical protein
MRSAFTVAALLVLIGAAIARAVKVPDPAPATAPASVFAADRAMRHVREMALRPHPSGGEDHPRVRAYLLRELRGLGLSPVLQEATGVSTRYAAAGRVWNVLARVPGRTPGAAVLLMAHYDGVPASPGAGDDGSGSAVLLETLRAIRATDTLAHDVIALFTDGEEAGLLGAAAFVREHPWVRHVAVTLNFEARGTHGPSFMFETGPGNLDVVRVLRGVGGGRATSLSTAVYRALPNDTDLTELAALERPAMNFAFIGGVERYHSAEDDAAHLDIGTLQHHGSQALALTRAFANGPLPRPRTGDAVFFDLPALGLIVYPAALAPWLGFLALLLPVGALVVRRREPKLLAGVAIGFTIAIVTAVVAGTIGLAAANGMASLHGSIGSGAPEWSSVYALAIALMALAVAASGYAFGRRWGDGFAVQAGALIAWGALGLWLALAMPGVSFLFAWPGLFFGIALMLTALKADRRTREVMTWLATIVAILLVAPTLYLMICVALGVNPAGAAILALLTALGSTLLWVHFESIAPRRWWGIPAAAGVAAIVLFVVGTITVRSTRARPTGAALLYAVDADSGKAWLSGLAWSSGARLWLSRALQSSGTQRADSSPAWVRRYADRANLFDAPMSIPALAPAVATVLSDSMAGANRDVVLRITPSRGTRSIGLRAESGSVLTARVDGRPIDASRYRRRLPAWALTYTAPPDSGFVLALTFAEGAAPTIGIISRRIGIPPLSGIRIPPRPEGIIAVGDGDGSMVYTRFAIERR